MEHFADNPSCSDSVIIKVREAADEAIFLNGFEDYFRYFTGLSQEFRDVFWLLRHAKVTSAKRGANWI
jgi:hypothetical protein